MARATSDQLGIHSSVAGTNEAMLPIFIREYLNNGLAAFDSERRRFGIVTDYDHPGRCFVVRVSQPSASLCIPFAFVRRVRHGKVFISAPVRDLLTVRSRANPAGAVEFELHRPFAGLLRRLGFSEASA